MASKPSDDAPAPASGSSATASDCKLGILDLPQETQKDIVSHCSQGDLICLSLVNKHFRELAAAQLYRNFHIIFPDEDDPSYESPIDGLAGGLDTFVTSDYNYAKHLKDLSLDTLSAGHKAETAYKPYLFSVSCGKFMNTLLLMTLRKSTTLESFKWNIRVELSRPVYKALHQINTLRHLHIRLQAGPSLYEAPPPLPFTSAPPSTYPPAAIVGHLPDIVPPPPPPPGFGMAPPPSLFYVAPPITSAPPPPPLPKPPARVKIPKKTSRSKEPPTLSGFKDLKSLSVLDIDSLDIITEIKTCVRNSSGTLTKLKLSFSDALAAQARKPPPELDPEDSDPDDEFQVVPVPTNTSPPYMDDVSGPAKVFRAQEERKSQEAVLGRIFDVEPYMVKKSKRRITDKIVKEAKEEPAANAGTDFIDAIKAMSSKLMKELNGAGALNLQQQETLDIIEAAARKYVAAEEAKGTTAGKDDQKAEGQKDEGASASAGSASNSKSQEAAKDSAEQSGSAGDLFSTKTTKVKGADKDVSPDDIIIEEPEEQLAIEAPETSNANDGQASEAAPDVEVTPAETPPPLKNPLAYANGKTVPPNVGKAICNLEAQKHNFKTLADKLETYEAQVTRLNDELLGLRTTDGSLDLTRIEDAEKQMQSFSRNIMDIQNEMHIVEAEIDDAEKQIPQVISDATAKTTEDSQAGQQRRISEYVRSTRGMGLQTLSIHLIPVKASILSKAVDIRVLRSITLLNVGHQAPIWSLFAKENKQSPLALRKIVTDNVSVSFLNFVSQLEEVHDLFMLERDTKYKPESFAPKSNVTMDMIRPRVLRKHIHCLKRLMIKNMSSQDWDLDEKTTLLIARRGRNLEELAVSLNIRAIHTLMQQISGLVNLRALHVIHLRNDDTCVWVMRETKRFLVDNLSHHPELKLEWVSIDDDTCAERILRPSEVPKKTKKKKSKGKEKATVPFINGNSPFPPLPPIDAWDAVDESEEEDEDLQTLKLETIEGVHFSDVWGVRIFKKEVTTGRL